MAFFGSAHFNSTARFDEPVPPLNTPRRGTHMDKIRLDLKSKTPDEKVTQAQTHHDGPFATSAFAATAVPTQAELESAAAAMDAALAQVEAAKAALKNKQLLRDKSELELDDILTRRAKFCEAASGGDGVLLTAWGFALASDPTPVGAMTAPQNLVAEMSDAQGVMELAWKAVRGADSYPVESSLHVVPRVWTQVKIVSKPGATILGLISGQTYAFRVRATGPSGEGPYSDEAIKMAP